MIIIKYDIPLNGMIDFLKSKRIIINLAFYFF